MARARKESSSKRDSKRTKRSLPGEKVPARKTPKKGGRSLAITGVNSFIGANLFGRMNIDTGIEKIVAIDIRKPPLASKKTRYHKIDLTEPLADARIAEIIEEEECDTFVHLAFLGSPSRRTSFAHELEDIGTMYVLHACAGVSSVEKLIVGSTAMVYGADPRNPNYLSERHPLNGNMGYPYVREKVGVEKQVERFRRKNPSMCVTVLRPCTIVGPTINNFVTRYFSRITILTLLGYDPLVQFVHEEDVIDLFQMVLNNDYPGVYNVVGKGVLPLSTVIRLMGKVNLPMIYFSAYPLVSALWSLGLTEFPPQHLDYIRYLWVADGMKAEAELGFKPKYSTKEAISSFVGMERLRKVHLAK